MEITGISVSQNTLEEIGAENEEKLASLTREIYDLAGEEFNINSPKQLGVILFEKLQLPVGKKTKTGYSTAVDVLEDLAALFLWWQRFWNIVKSIKYNRLMLKA